jgi:hypothetical protein
VLVGPAPGATVANAVMLAGAGFGKLEVCTEGLALTVNEVAELVARAEGRVSVVECFLATLGHVRMGPT